MTMAGRLGFLHKCGNGLSHFAVIFNFDYGASPTIIGIIEGIAESLASVIKLFSGIIADKYGNKKRARWVYTQRLLG
jgi:nitrate/nitrite transporter NarK